MREILVCVVGCLISTAIVAYLLHDKATMEHFYGNANIDVRVAETYEDDLVNERFTSYTAGTH